MLVNLSNSTSVLSTGAVVAFAATASIAAGIASTIYHDEAGAGLVVGIATAITTAVCARLIPKDLRAPWIPKEDKIKAALYGTAMATIGLGLPAVGLAGPWGSLAPAVFAIFLAFTDDKQNSEDGVQSEIQRLLSPLDMEYNPQARAANLLSAAAAAAPAAANPAEDVNIEANSYLEEALDLIAQNNYAEAIEAAQAGLSLTGLSKNTIKNLQQALTSAFQAHKRENKNAVTAEV